MFMSTLLYQQISTTTTAVSDQVLDICQAVLDLLILTCSDQYKPSNLNKVRSMLKLLLSHNSMFYEWMRMCEVLSRRISKSSPLYSRFEALVMQGFNADVFYFDPNDNGEWGGYLTPEGFAQRFMPSLKGFVEANQLVEKKEKEFVKPCEDVYFQSLLRGSLGKKIPKFQSNLISLHLNRSELMFKARLFPPQESIKGLDKNSLAVYTALYRQIFVFGHYATNQENFEGVMNARIKLLKRQLDKTGDPTNFLSDFLGNKMRTLFQSGKQFMDKIERDDFQRQNLQQQEMLTQEISNLNEESENNGGKKNISSEIDLKSITKELREFCIDQEKRKNW